MNDTSVGSGEGGDKMDSRPPTDDERMVEALARKDERKNIAQCLIGKHKKGYQVQYLHDPIAIYVCERCGTLFCPLRE